eukprot:2866031-Rhodomonas_salina.1
MHSPVPCYPGQWMLKTILFAAEIPTFITRHAMTTGAMNVRQSRAPGADRSEAGSVANPRKP